jgi:hypothetical protein
MPTAVQKALLTRSLFSLRYHRVSVSKVTFTSPLGQAYDFILTFSVDGSFLTSNFAIGKIGIG